VSSRSRRRATVETERILIPAGSYIAGPNDENPKLAQFSEAQSLAKRELPAFYVGETPVTNGEYAAFVAATRRAPPKHWNGLAPPVEVADHPVVFVSCFDARAFAEWIGGRLLTEEEWERAARGVDGRRYPWGEWAKGRCNSVEAGIWGTTPVGRLSPSGDSPCGCADIAGNVQEWTSSHSGKYKVIRGGTFNHNRTLAQTFFAVRHVPGFSSRNIGFRVGRDA